MKKIVFAWLLAFCLPALVHAQTLFGFMDGTLYDKNGRQLYACFADNTCVDEQDRIYTRQELGIAPPPLTVAPIADTAPTQVAPPIAIPTTSPAIPAGPMGSSNIPPVVAAPAIIVTPLAPPYSKSDLLQKVGLQTHHADGTITLTFPFSIRADSPTTAVPGANGTVANQTKVIFNGKVVFDCSVHPFCGTPFIHTVDPDGTNEYNPLPAITGLQPDTDYPYQIIYSEVGHEDTILDFTFHTPAN